MRDATPDAEALVDKTNVEKQARADKQGRPKKAAESAEMIVQSAPKEVYTAGFQQDNGVKDPYRFTGKAVEFMSVAKFKK